MLTDDPFELMSRSEIEHLIDEYVFNERNRAILKRRMLDGIPFKEIATEFNLDYDYVKKLYYKSRREFCSKVSKITRK